MISYEELTDGNISTALKYVKVPEKMTPGIYRGWMLTPDQYAALYGLFDENIQLINNPTEYQHCHYLPDSYHKIEAKTPKSIWTAEYDETTIRKLLSEFGNSFHHRRRLCKV
ncbi:MAG: hypothetical protein R3B93_01360 [Bacteroidia bacterium]